MIRLFLIHNSVSAGLGFQEWQKYTLPYLLAIEMYQEVVGKYLYVYWDFLELSHSWKLT